MSIALDTNRYVDLCKGDESVVFAVAQAKEVFVPFIVLAELLAGFALGTQLSANQRTLRLFFAKPGITVLYARESTTHVYASLYRQLRQQGTPIPTNDLWIAALVVERGIPLCTRDRHFRHLPQLTLI